MKKRALALLLCALALFPSFSALGQPSGGEMVFHFLQLDAYKDESIGDCTIVELPNGQIMVIDAMMPECGGEIVRQLRSMGVQKIDYLIFTHMHIDHIGGMAAIMDAFPVGALYGPGVPYSTETYKAYLDAQKRHGVFEQPLQKGDVLTLGDVTLHVLSPEIDGALHRQFEADTLTVAQTNQYSLVFTLCYLSFRALFTGDIYQETEKALVKAYGEDLRCDLLKIPHHGSDSSGSKAFIQAASPKIAVAMGNTGMEPWLYKRYSTYAKTYLTLLDGTVTVRTDGTAAEASAQWERNAPRYPFKEDNAA